MVQDAIKNFQIVHQRALLPLLGTASRVSEVMSGKRD
jgi:antitoxin component HigA of HigAB toxin-antitoxin module